MFSQKITSVVCGCRSLVAILSEQGWTWRQILYRKTKVVIPSIICFSLLMLDSVLFKSVQFWRWMFCSKKTRRSPALFSVTGVKLRQNVTAPNKEMFPGIPSGIKSIRLSAYKHHIKYARAYLNATIVKRLLNRKWMSHCAFLCRNWCFCYERNMIISAVVPCACF